MRSVESKAPHRRRIVSLVAVLVALAVSGGGYWAVKALRRLPPEQWAYLGEQKGESQWAGRRRRGTASNERGSMAPSGQLGHAKGAYTGAIANRKGLREQANGKGG
jgi:hypothetical protein